MKLIHFRGLNCYYDCIVSIADGMGKDYAASFADLWSETDFKYDPYRQVFLSKRMLLNLEAQGVRLEMLNCKEQKQALESLSVFDEGEWIIVGMDAFYIPWNPLFRLHHGPHYFMAQKEKADTLTCFDPTYQRKNERIECKAIVLYAFDISRLAICNPFQNGTKASLTPLYEAKEILRCQPQLRRNFLGKLRACLTEEAQTAVLLAKYTDALISNRFLYQHYLEPKKFLYGSGQALWDCDFFTEWTAIKNGLYKAAGSRRKKSVLDAVEACFNSLMGREASAAEKLIELLER